jgi:hypothetical protein
MVREAMDERGSELQIALLNAHDRMGRKLKTILDDIKKELRNYNKHG